MRAATKSTAQKNGRRGGRDTQAAGNKLPPSIAVWVVKASDSTPERINYFDGCTPPEITAILIDASSGPEEDALICKAIRNGGRLPAGSGPEDILERWWTDPETGERIIPNWDEAIETERREAEEERLRREHLSRVRAEASNKRWHPSRTRQNAQDAHGATQAARTAQTTTKAPRAARTVTNNAQERPYQPPAPRMTERAAIALATPDDNEAALLAQLTAMQQFDNGRKSSLEHRLQPTIRTIASVSASDAAQAIAAPPHAIASTTAEHEAGQGLAAGQCNCIPAHNRLLRELNNNRSETTGAQQAAQPAAPIAQQGTQQPAATDRRKHLPMIRHLRTEQIGYVLRNAKRIAGEMLKHGADLTDYANRRLCFLVPLCEAAQMLAETETDALLGALHRARNAGAYMTGAIRRMLRTKGYDFDRLAASLWLPQQWAEPGELGDVLAI